MARQRLGHKPYRFALLVKDSLGAHTFLRRRRSLL
jgi:hypothetical protein